MKSLRRQGRKIRKTRPNNNSQSCGGATGHEIVAAGFAGLICLPASLDFTFVVIRFETSVRDSSAGQSANFGHFIREKPVRTDKFQYLVPAPPSTPRRS